MTDETEATGSVAPEVMEEGQVEGQTAEVEEDGEPQGEPEADTEEKKRESAKDRRERDKAYKARLRQEAEEAKAQAAAAEARLNRIKARTGEAPKESDFADPLEYVAAKAAWNYTRQAAERDAEDIGAEAETAKKRAESVAAQERQLVAENWQMQVEEARTRYADFDRVVFDPRAPIPPGVADLIVAGDNAADVAYFLAKNRATAAEIAKMSPIEAARAIGRIEARISAPKPKTETTAPEPISPVRGTAAAQRDPSKMSYEDYKKWRTGSR